MDFSLTLFGVLYVVTFIIPGLIFKRFFYQGKFSKQFFEGLFTDRLLTYILWGIAIQLITIICYCLFFDIKAAELYLEFTNFYSSISKEKVPEFKFSYLQHMLRYLLATMICAIALGVGLHLLVRFLKIDIRFSVFRFSNSWHYYFTGESLNFKEFKAVNQLQNIKVLSAEVDIVVKTDDGRSNMFSGVLTQYTLSRMGELQTIYLTGAKRFSTSTTPGYLKPIPGDCFIIPYGNILNINIRYNIASKPNKRILKIIFLGIILSATILSVFFAIIYPWFVAPTFWRKLTSCLIFCMGWFNLMNVVLSIANKNAPPLKTGFAKLTSLVIAGLLVSWGFVITKTITWIEIFEHLKFWNFINK